MGRTLEWAHYVGVECQWWVEGIGVGTIYGSIVLVVGGGDMSRYTKWEYISSGGGRAQE